MAVAGGLGSQRRLLITRRASATQPNATETNTYSLQGLVSAMLCVCRYGAGCSRTHDLLAWPVMLAACLVVSGSPRGHAVAQDQAVQTVEQAQPSKQAEDLTRESVEAAIEKARAAQGLDDATRNKIIEQYTQALESLKRNRELESAARLPEKISEQVQQNLAATKAAIANLSADPQATLPELPTPETANLGELEQHLTAVENALATKKKELERLEAEPKRRAARRKDIRSLLFSLPERLKETEKQLEAPPPADEPSGVTSARQSALRARLLALRAEKPALESELASYDAEDAEGLVRLRRDLLTQQVAALDRQAKAVSDRINRLRQKEAEEVARQARQKLADTHPLLEPYVEQSRQWAETAKRIAKEIELADDALKQAREKLEAVRSDFRDTRQKVIQVGLTGPIGFQLRNKRSSLPDVRQHRINLNQRRETFERVQWESFEYDDLRSELANPEPIIRRILQEANGRLSEQERQELEAAARDVIDMQRQNLDLLNRNYQIFLDTLIELDKQVQDLIEQTEAFTAYIDENVLWIRSSKPLSLAELQRDYYAFLGLFAPQQWLDVGTTLFNDLKQNPVPFAAAVLLFGTLFYFGSQFRRELADIGNQVERTTFYHILPTVRAIFLTAIISIFWPGLVWYISWRLSTSAQTLAFAGPLSHALRLGAAALLPLEFVRQTCRTRGLAEAHFGWSRAAVRRLRNNLRWLVMCGMPLLVVAGILHAGDPEPRHDSIERVAFILAMVVLAFFAHRILRPVGGVLHELIEFKVGGWFDRLKHLWAGLGGLLPLFLAGLAAVGYYYTATQLSWRLQETFWLLLILLYARDFFVRWMLVHRRKLGIKQARERRAAAAEEREGAQDASMPANTPPAEEMVADLAAISTQTQRLVATGLTVALAIGMWVIWVDILPALNALDRWEVWYVTTDVPVEELETPADAAAGDGAAQQNGAEPAAAAPTGPAGRTITALTADAEVRETRTVIKAITAANLAAALLVGVLTFISARNVPGLLEMSLLQRLPLEASVRYAISRVASYAIVLLGLVIGFNAIGLGWSKIQWLATALTFGLAFGLQEIFANFVSGLIILFERPIRVGDIVTVDDITGIVSRVRIRATTITNWDRKEYVVPNKEFITGRVLNWTLTDATNRVVVNVGVAYGSNTDRAREILLQVAHENPIVLDDPAPIATFEGFGDSTLNLVLRAYLPNMENRLPVINELHTGVDQAFRAAGIEIAFPQRDLHLRSLPTGWTPDGFPNAEPISLPGSGEGDHG